MAPWDGGVARCTRHTWEGAAHWGEWWSACEVGREDDPSAELAGCGRQAVLDVLQLVRVGCRTSVEQDEVGRRRRLVRWLYVYFIQGGL